MLKPWIDYLEPGDVLLYERGGSSKKTTFFGRLVRLICGSEFTHAALVVADARGKLWIAEQHIRVRLYDPAELLKDPGTISVYSNPSMSWRFSDALFLAAKQYEGCSYGYLSLLDDLLVHLLAKVKKSYTPKAIFTRSTKHLTCSGLVARVMWLACKNREDIPKFMYQYSVAEPDDFSKAENGFRLVFKSNDLVMGKIA